MTEAYIIDACRTPRGIGKVGKGALADIHPQQLAASVLKAVAELRDMTLGDLLEGIVLHAFEGKMAFSAGTLKEIEQFKKIYGLTLRASDSHRLKERE